MGRCLFKSALFCFLFLIGSGRILGQDKLILSAGAGFAEFYNVGLKYPYKKLLLGINAGILPKKEGTPISVSAEAYYHFKSIYRSLDSGPWYIRSGLGYLWDKSVLISHSYLLISARGGRDFNISKRIRDKCRYWIGFFSYKASNRNFWSTSWFWNRIVLSSITVVTPRLDAKS